MGCKKKAAETETVVTFEQYSELEIFQDIPAMDTENYSIVHEADYGAGWYVMELKGKVLPTYKTFNNYIKTLESVGFEKFAEWGLV